MPSRIPDEYQKWDYITLSDFHSSSCGTFLSYGWLWFLAFVGIAVYGSDTYTAVNLLAFDRWGSTFKPIIPLDIAKWVFAGCIILSWVLLGFEWIRAIRVIKRQNVAESYLDPLAVTVQSMRMGKNGQGWRRFLVFKELTKSRKGADYVALFCYFQFKGAIRVCLAEGPRQVINGLTLYSVMRASLIPTGSQTSTGGHSPFDQFWLNVKVLYDSSPRQAIILGTMLFTLVIWLFSAICLLSAAVCYVGFLWHYLPKMALSKYCRRKVDKRLSRVVNEKTKSALDREDAKRRKDEEKGGKASQGFGPPSRAATLPMLADDSSSVHPSTLHHTGSVSTTVGAPSLFSGQDTAAPYDPRKPTLPNLGYDSERPMLRQGSMADTFSNQYPVRPGIPSRSGTQNSNVSISSFGSDRPLLQRANSFDQTAPPPVEHDPLPARMAPNMGRKPLPIRSMTGSSVRAQSPMQSQMYPPMHPPLERSQTAQSLNAPDRRPSVAEGPAYEMQAPPMARRPLPNAYQQQAYQPPPPSAPPLADSVPSFTPYTPFRPSHPSDDPPAPSQPPQPTRAFSVAAGSSAPTQPMDRATPPPRMGTAPPMQGWRRPPPQSQPLNQAYAPASQSQQAGGLPWQSPNPT